MEEVSFRVYERHGLPHWRARDVTYFVTWRLHRKQAPLTPAERPVVEQAVRHFDGVRYRLHAWVVMNDHVHVVLTPNGGWRLEQLLHSWKSFTAHRLCQEFGRVEPVWVEGSYDRIVRDEDELREKIEYVLANPVRRWPGVGEYPWRGPQ